MRSGQGSSGNLKNSGKSFFRVGCGGHADFNNQRDKNGLSYAWKAMIRTGMALNLTGLWEKQLFTELQGIIAKHQINFDG